MKSKKLAFAIFIVLLLIPLATAADITIGAGAAEIFNNNEKEARNQAINNALKNIVKKEVALLLDPVALLKHRAAIKERLYNKARDFIKEYEIVKDELKNKSVYIQVKANATSEAVKKHLTELHILQSKINYTRLMTVYNSRHPQALPLQNIAVYSALSAVGSEFKRSIFLQVVDRNPNNIHNIPDEEREAAEKCLKSIYNSSRTENTKKTCENIKDKYRIDALAEFEIIPDKEKTSPELTFSHATVAVKMKAYDLSSRELISNVESNQRQLTDASEETPRWNNAVSVAAEKAAGTAAFETVKNMLEHYKNTGKTHNNFLVIFQKISENKKENITEALQSIEGYQSMLPSGDFDYFQVQYLSYLEKKRLAMKILIELKKLGLRTKYRELSGNRLLFVSL